MSKRSYTFIPMDDGTKDYAKSCNDCGAYVIGSGRKYEPEVVHHASCHPGESEYWKKHYDNIEENTDG